MNVEEQTSIYVYEGSESLSSLLSKKGSEFSSNFFCIRKQIGRVIFPRKVMFVISSLSFLSPLHPGAP